MNLKNVIYSLIIVLFWSCQRGGEQELDVDGIVYFSDLETLEGNQYKNSTGLFLFGGGEMMTTEFSKSGKQSIKLDSAHLYGLNFLLTDVKEGEMYQASVWQKKGASDGTFICVMKGENPRSVRTFRSDVEDGDWYLHSMSFVVGKGIDSLQFYVFAGGQTAYFDDIRIKRFSGIPSNDDLNNKPLRIYIPDSSNTKLQGYVDDALTASVIAKKNKKYVDAFIVNDYDSIPIEMRLKGDWTDHLTSGKTSYRIKVRGNNAFMGMKTFSIQHPKTRNYQHEWLMHKLCDEEGLLSTNYEMIPVEINGVNKGVYALEEHFDKQLLESRNRREGPILKLDESGVWALSFLSSEQNLNKSFPYYRASFVSMFKAKRTLKNDNLRQQFEEGAKLLTLFKNHCKSVEDIFDVESLAKYHALMELGSIDHAFAWHNRRFYFNPVTQKLELIGFDMLPGVQYDRRLFLFDKVDIRPKAAEEMQLTKMTLKNNAFKKHYFNYLNKFTDSTYLNNVFSQFDSTLTNNEKMIAIEIDGYQFNRDFYFKRANFIRSQISELDSLWEVYLSKDLKKSDFILKSNYTPNEDDLFVEEVSVNAYHTKLDSGKHMVEIENYHLNNIFIIGYEDKDKVEHKLNEPITLKAYNDENGVDSSHFIGVRRAKKIVFKIENNPSVIYKKKVLKYGRPKGVTTRMELKSKFKEKSPFYKASGDRLMFNGGSYTIDELIYIPKKYKVTIPLGANITLSNGGGIIINNDLIIAGTKNHPVAIKGENENNHGITVLNGSKVVLKYVTFDGLNTLHYKKWLLTGGVSIYETETVMQNCKVINNHCEDGLNIIRSNFTIDSLLVENTYSDGFDADFCTGEITNSTFINTGNDCIDFSGSKVNINHIDILNSGDKGISGGERSELTLLDINVNGAITGVAAKDDTKIYGDSIHVENAEFGLAAFQKKAEYDKAYINLTNVTYHKLQQYGLLEMGSIAAINNKIYYGGMLVDVDKLYARFEKK